MKVDFKHYFSKYLIIRTNSILYSIWRINYGKWNFHNYYGRFNSYFRYDLHNSAFTLIHVKV